VVVFDDVGYPAIRRVCEYVLGNRSYEIYDLVEHGKAPTPRQRVKALLREWLRPIYRTDQTPTRETRRLLAPLRDAYFLALRKLGDDERRFDHFVHF
jgi:hypothetical protein